MDKSAQLKFTLRCLIVYFFLFSFAYAKPTSATFAAGCFWCAQSDFEKIPGVISVTSGYTGGQVQNPTYEHVSKGGTGHFEAVKLNYDDEKISYQQLLDVFWRNIDPTDAHGQFCDNGDQYRAVIFYQNPNEKKLAEQSKASLIHSGQFTSIATLILPTTQFYPAEEYHQDYAKKNPVRYHYYRYTCGRDARLKQVWQPSQR